MRSTLFRAGAVGGGVAVLALIGLQFQASRRLTREIDQLTGRIAELQPAAPPRAQTAGFRGRVLLGDGPFKAGPVQIWRVGELRPFRTVVASETGEFESGPIPEGDYYTVVGQATAAGEWAGPPTREQPARPWRLVQSRTFTVAQGFQTPPVTLDALYRPGSIEFDLAAPVESEIKAGGATIHLSLHVGICPRETRVLPVDPRDESLFQTGPIAGFAPTGGDTPWSEQVLVVDLPENNPDTPRAWHLQDYRVWSPAMESTDGSPIDDWRSPPLPPGRYQVAVWIAGQILPPSEEESQRLLSAATLLDGVKPAVADQAIEHYRGFFDLLPTQADYRTNVVSTGSDTRYGVQHVSGTVERHFAVGLQSLSVTVREDRNSRLRVEWEPDIVAAIRESLPMLEQTV
ncbi:MAG TPA: hypothetical protein VHB77_13025, partial [Planctomycetaceae bacterium]|nr:hypothetical protein [Planctomycetaceae bacterium]